MPFGCRGETETLSQRDTKQAGREQPRRALQSRRSGEMGMRSKVNRVGETRPCRLSRTM